ncbi:hypothetical protein FTV88_1263 [Heliorestis convoluta]|uniref:Uncharacterized protein n=1 Tax=Heliorestis convoluta TaxID=356322 RepID=A0A5Q2N589_9FIRM|nr:hypothetical protein FTV88_1263 [Heliorestis convoluta]
MFYASLNPKTKVHDTQLPMDKAPRNAGFKAFLNDTKYLLTV